MRATGLMPPPGADFVAISEYGHRFDAYEMWAESPRLLHRLVQPILDVFDETGSLPAGLQVQPMRAALFHLLRELHLTDCGDGSGERRIRAYYSQMYGQVSSMKSASTAGGAFHRIPNWQNAISRIMRDFEQHGSEIDRKLAALQAEYAGRRAVMVIDVIASRQRKYDSRVRNGIIPKFEVTPAAASLRALATLGPGDGLGLRPGEDETMRRVAEGLADYCAENSLTEDDGCRAWAESAEAFEFASKLEPVVGHVNGMGPALFAYLRLLCGADALKPDLRVAKELGPEGYGLPVGTDPHALLTVCHAICAETDMTMAQLDQLLWWRNEMLSGEESVK